MVGQLKSRQVEKQDYGHQAPVFAGLANTRGPTTTIRHTHRTSIHVDKLRTTMTGGLDGLKRWYTFLFGLGYRIRKVECRARLNDKGTS